MSLANAFIWCVSEYLYFVISKKKKTFSIISGYGPTALASDDVCEIDFQVSSDDILQQIEYFAHHHGWHQIKQWKGLSDYRNQIVAQTHNSSKGWSVYSNKFNARLVETCSEQTIMSEGCVLYLAHSLQTLSSEKCPHQCLTREPNQITSAPHGKFKHVVSTTGCCSKSPVDLTSLCWPY